MNASEILFIAIVLGALLALFMSLVRLFKGPDQADRVVALDVVFSANLALVAAAAFKTEQSLYLDVGIGLAMVGFVATIVWSRLIDKSPEERG